MKILPLFLILIALAGCYPVETSSRYNKDFTWAHSQSDPIYLSFRDTKNSPFYFMLSRDTNHKDYKLHVRWHSNNKNDLLFNGYDSTLKFLVNKEKIMSFNPVKKPKVVAFDLNTNGHDEEALFSLTKEEFLALAYAKEVNVELTGRYHSVNAYFNQRNTMRAFQNFAENSY